MKTRASKTTENKSQAVINHQAQKQGASTATFQFVDNRPEAIVQRKIQTMADNKLAVPIQKKEVEEDELLQGKFKPVQKQELEEEELLQGKFNPVQKQGLEEEELLQGKFKTVQRQELEEEELLQGKFKPVQKQELEDEELLQGKFKTVQKQELEEEELLQGKFDSIQKKASSEQGKVTNDTGLPDNLKSGIENLSGYSMDDVKVHRNSDKPGQLQAHAYAQGTDIHLGPGQEKHLPHEAWHVVQQKQGRVKPTLQMKSGVNVNDDAGLEKEADVMGEEAVQKKENSIITTHIRSPFNENSSTIQRVLAYDKDIKANEVTQIEQKGSKLVFELTGPAGDKVIVKFETFSGGENKALLRSRNEFVQNLASGLLPNLPGSKELSDNDMAELQQIGDLGEAATLLKNVLRHLANHPEEMLGLKKQSMNVGENLRDIMENDKAGDGAGASGSAKVVRGKKDLESLYTKSQKLLLNPKILNSLGRTAAFDLFIGNYDRFRPNAEDTNLENIDTTASGDEILSLDNLDTQNPIVNKDGDEKEWEGREILTNHKAMEIWAFNMYFELTQKAELPESSFDKDLVNEIQIGMNEAITKIKSKKGIMTHFSLNQGSWNNDENRAIAAALLKRINELP